MLSLFRQALFCLLLLWPPFSWAQETGWLHSTENNHASVRLRADASPQGESRVLLDVKLEEGWKTYWRSPGDGGVAPTISWHEPVRAADWFWPVPQRFDVAGITTQGYHNQVSIPMTLSGDVPKKIAGVLTLSTCKDVCLLTDFPFEITPNKGDETFAHDYAQAMGKVPRPDGLTDNLIAGYRNAELVVQATRAAGWQKPELFLDMPEDASFGKPKYRIDGETLWATIPVSDGWDGAGPDLRGRDLSLVIADNGIAQQSSVTINEAPIAPESGKAIAFWQVLLLALLGGFILNLMPCVLPVLGMKLGSVLLVEKQERRVIRQQFLASVAGILVSFMALALLMTVLRLTNHAVGWGIQFQNVWFIGFMALVMVVFSANLFGLFEFRLSSNMTTKLATQGGRGMSGHFWQGALATLLATPCSAPFLGTAVAVALGSSLPTLWGIFLALGVGMSLPWLLIAIRPSLALRLPRPGRWMHWLRRILAVMMLGSALWLVSLLPVHFSASAVAPANENIAWQPLSEQAIVDALAQNKRVFIDVTADWCITCKLNKLNVLSRDDVQATLQAPDVVALRGDWTLPSKEITEFLKLRGQVGVPFNQVYGPNIPAGKPLPTLLTRDSVLNALNDAKGTKQ
ncbi:protein-disulfide reductase [Buttiauxella sp. B2]|uniref:protein-disulfide reductase DsbD family protein n=1 Tax=Buttiauxella sp. B2 TaxID=2587812 RepID=UPI0011234290|nr:protein-disulfide reductase DsbD domain-containing protein [Buttiauxella sp. B2]TNV13114.1 protein-disulfide reductase [Buttiauxella sp. B2]